MKNNIIPVKRENEDAIWVKISKEFTGFVKDIYLGTVYHNPSGDKKENTEKYQALNGDYHFFSVRAMCFFKVTSMRIRIRARIL